MAKFAAKGTAPTQAARSTALMVLNEDQLAADKLGCTMGTYLRSYGRMCGNVYMAWHGMAGPRSPSALCWSSLCTLFDINPNHPPTDQASTLAGSRSRRWASTCARAFASRCTRTGTS